jgi:type IV pilus assembly protein PilE
MGRRGINHLRGAGGFTLIELLVAVAIIGTLAGIAVVQYLGFRQRVYDARAMHDLGNAATAEEAYYAAHFTYVEIINVVGPQVLDVPGLVVSDTVTLTVKPVGPEAFTASATSSKGTGKTFTYDSVTDTIVAEDAPLP